MRAWIKASLIARLELEGDTHFPLETGGVLVGHWNGADAVITDASGPGPHAKHANFAFTPDGDFQEQFVADVYERSGRVCTYLGDWHTHPNGSERLSCADKRTMTSIARSRAARAPQPLMLILADGNPWEAHVWMRSRAFALVASFRKMPLKHY